MYKQARDNNKTCVAATVAQSAWFGSGASPFFRMQRKELSAVLLHAAAVVLHAAAAVAVAELAAGLVPWFSGLHCRHDVDLVPQL